MSIFKDNKWKKRKDRNQQESEKTSVTNPATDSESKNGQKPIGKAKPSQTVDPDREFKMMYGMVDEVPEKAVYAKKTITIKPPKPLVKKRLTIILVENTEVVGKEKEKVLQLVESLAKSDLTCIINYGKTVVQSEIFENSNTELLAVSNKEMTGEEACFYDALVQLYELVDSKYLLTEEKKDERVQISNIHIIGIGTGKDNGSATSKEEAISSFYKVASKLRVVTKYYCLSDEYVVNPAEFGFHSIGSFPKAFQ